MTTSTELAPVSANESHRGSPLPTGAMIMTRFMELRKRRGLLIALLCQGHVLLEGVPGVAKTLLVRSLAASLSLQSKRVQFTPDLMPGDITGSLIYDTKTSQFEFRQGPVFTNLLLADEINRTPPKTQAALLEAMEERQVSVEGTPRPLPVPFLVAATQNPVEYEGTYPLPEAQLDRFLLKLTVALPERGEEIGILDRHAAGFDPRDLAAAGIRQVAGGRDLAAARTAVRTVRLSPEITGYIVDICRATRPSAARYRAATSSGPRSQTRFGTCWAGSPWLNSSQKHIRSWAKDRGRAATSSARPPIGARSGTGGMPRRCSISVIGVIFRCADIGHDVLVWPRWNLSEPEHR